MKYAEAMICWNDGGAIEVGPWPDRTGWSRRYMFSVGACFSSRRQMSTDELFRTMLWEFHYAVVDHGVDPVAADREFRKIEEYAKFRDEGGL